MPEKSTLRRARRDKRQGKAPSTQAGEFVREEMHHVREGKHGARSTKQAIAIGLSKARRSGVKLIGTQNCVWLSLPGVIGNSKLRGITPMTIYGLRSISIVLPTALRSAWKRLFHSE